MNDHGGLYVTTYVILSSESVAILEDFTDMAPWVQAVQVESGRF